MTDNKTAEFITDPIDLEDAYRLIGNIEHEIAVIQAKLDRARGHYHQTGEWSDPDWYARAKSALRFKGVEHQRLQRIAGQMRRQQLATLESAFVDTVRNNVSDDAFQALMRSARAKIGPANTTRGSNG